MKYLLAAMVCTIFGAQAATIAIIDSGVDTEHVDLVHKLWINPVEKAGNGRDEDRNGYQDDVFSSRQQKLFQWSQFVALSSRILIVCLFFRIALSFLDPNPEG